MGSSKKSTINKIHYGFVPGIILPLMTFAIVFFTSNQDVSLSGFLSGMWQLQALVKMLTLCVIPNLFLFLYYYQKKFDMAARGVLLATFIYAFIVVISKAF